MWKRNYSFFLYLLVLLMGSCSALKRDSKREVLTEFRLTVKGAYCGGARPSDEMLAQLTAPKALGDVQFYIKPGHINDPDIAALASSITDADGLAFVNLCPGEYVLIFEDKLDWTVYNERKQQYAQPEHPFGAIDTVCLNQWIRQPEMQFTVRPSTNSIILIERQEKCFWNNIPCLEYLGSLPP
jgi:hypothetical protein